MERGGARQYDRSELFVGAQLRGSFALALAVAVKFDEIPTIAVENE